MAAGLVLFSANSYANTCNYELQKDSTQVGWTAYKTTQKAPVEGSFPKAKISGASSSRKGLSDLLSKMKADVSFGEVAEIHTGNPTRDQTLLDHFFSLIKGKEVKGSLAKVKGSDTEGDFELKLEMNGVTKEVPMHYIRDNAGKLEAKGEIDVLNFGLDTALADLHKSCETLHKGADGVSRTWNTVALRLTSTITKTCK